MDNFFDDKTIGQFSSPPGSFIQSPQSAQKSKYLIIIDNTRQIRTVELKDECYTFGRTGDISVSSAIVSRNHGEFTKLNGEFCFRDTGSTNGTFYNGEQLQPSPGSSSNSVILRNGDVLRICSRNPQISSENVLIIFSSDNISKNSWQYINLAKYSDCLMIGRSVPENHLRLDSMQVSKRHARIINNNGNYIVADVGSLNGTIVNGNRLTGSHILSNMDVICIANIKIIFLNGYLIFNRLAKGVKMQVNDISRVVGGGKVILDHVSLTIDSSSLVAIIGGSGAGKSTFLNCINGFEPATSGSVYMNGVDLYKHYDMLKSGIGYVPQKDELHDYLKVISALRFTAQLRLPNDISKSEINRRVDEVLTIMGLYEHRNTMIKKLSGGQRKRVSIALELISDPDIFFLDEPTSGLDPETETMLMNQLKYLSEEIGKTVIVITHTLQNIHLFDKIVFLAPGGKLCYYGTAENALPFFGVTSLPQAYEKIKNNVDYFVSKYNSMAREGRQ